MEKWQSKKKNNAMNQIAESMKSIVDNISTRNESLLPSETTESKSEDETFSMIIQMIVKMVSGVPECEEKYILKLRIQQGIINTCFSLN